MVPRATFTQPPAMGCIRAHPIDGRNRMQNDDAGCEALPGPRLSMHAFVPRQGRAALSCVALSCLSRTLKVDIDLVLDPYIRWARSLMWDR